MTTTHFSPPVQNHNATSPAPAANPGVATAVVVLSSLPPIPAPDPDVNDWVSKINEAVGEGVAWLLETGKHLVEAKAALGHGRWMAMFESGQIQIGLRSAETFMRIAEHRTLSDSQHHAILPPSLTTLDVLAGGSVEVIEAGIKAGAIHAELTAKEARSYLRAHKPNPTAETRKARFNEAKRLQYVEGVLSKELERWPYEAVGPLADLLASYAEDLRSDLPPKQPQP